MACHHGSKRKTNWGRKESVLGLIRHTGKSNRKRNRMYMGFGAIQRSLRVLELIQNTREKVLLYYCH